MKIFLDSSVVIASLLSSGGGSAKIFELCECEAFEVYISSQVKEEVLEVLKRKLPELIEKFLLILEVSKVKIEKKVPGNFLLLAKAWIKDPKDVPILAAAKYLEVDCLLTLDIHHFIKDEDVAKKSGLKILTPGEFLQGLG